MKLATVLILSFAVIAITGNEDPNMKQTKLPLEMSQMEATTAMEEAKGKEQPDVMERRGGKGRKQQQTGWSSPPHHGPGWGWSPPPQIIPIPMPYPVRVPVYTPTYSPPAYSPPAYSAPSYSAPSYSAPSYSAPSYSSGYGY